MTEHVNQDTLAMLGIPPSRADGKITLAVASSEQVSTDLAKLGLTAADLKPIDWRKEIYKHNNSGLDYVKNQANCGNCWAQSSSAALTDRFMIRKGLDNLNLTSLLTTQCVPQTLDHGCGGGAPTQAGQYFEDTGLIDSTQCPSWHEFCTPAHGCGQGLNCQGQSCALSASRADCKSVCTPQVPTCATIDSKCSSGLVYKAKTGSTRTTAADTASATIVRMKQELQNGPYVVSYLVAKDFMAPAWGYKWDKTNGIYINGEYDDELDKNAPDHFKKALKVQTPSQWKDIITEGYKPTQSGVEMVPAAHAVELVGWDIGYAGKKYGKIPYWIVKNSWGPNWNEGGYFRIAMNDPDSNHPGLNSYLGLDVPIRYAVQASTGRQMINMGLFGSGTVFDPDESTGAPRHHKYSPKKHPKKHPKHGKHIVWKQILLWCFVVAIMAGLMIWTGPKLWKATKKTRGKK